MKDRNRITITNAFQKAFDMSEEHEASIPGRCVTKSKRRKLNKIWSDKGSEFYNESIKLWLQDSQLKIYNTQ